MANILETIIAKKKQEIEKQKRLISTNSLLLQKRNRQYFSLTNALTSKGSSGIIAEFKRKSPSKNWINKNAQIRQIVPNYQKSGAAACSILTDNFFFGGSTHDLIEAGNQVQIPLLRKEFIVDEYQIIEAAKVGADAILLIAACLSRQEVRHFSKTAKENNLEVLLEIHNEQELEHICETVDLVGVNNRNLKTFTTSLENSVQLSKKVPLQFVKISESGISTAEDIKYLRSFGFQGFLIGETFMKSNNPGNACQAFIKNLQP